MSHYRQRFLQLALDSNALCFGEFTLKSGRISPYFFNAGHFNSGTKTAALAQCNADAIDAANLNFDLMFR
ncbi:MAG TPA: orotate phosphoribosyltransferase, partial [Xylella fastidiosa subsp. pauca]